MKGTRYILFGLLAAATLAACGQGPVAVSNQEETQQPGIAQTSTPDKPTQEPTHTPTATLEPSATSTPTPIPLEGRLFFDMNGSGLRDMASFIYDADRLTDERQPLHPDLLAAITAYINEHPELQDGDLITLEEPGLSNYTVCAKDICSTTAADGSFVLPGATQNSYLNITDPNAGTPALEMRYINKWNKAVTVPAYEMNGVQVPEQNLNDTMVLPISKTVQVGKKGEIGLVQGFLTAPFPLNYPAYILGYFDIDGRYPWDKNGTSLNYLGETYNWTWGNPYSSTISDKIDKSTLVFPGVTGTQDGHDALDIRLDLLTPIISPIAGKVNNVYWENGQDIKLDHKLAGVDYQTFYGHLDTKVVVVPGQNIYRGQIIGFSGNTGEGNNGIAILHFAFIKLGPFEFTDNFVGDLLIDPYRTLVQGEYSLASSHSLWIIDNTLNPQTINCDPDGISLD